MTWHFMLYIMSTACWNLYSSYDLLIRSYSVIKSSMNSTADLIVDKMSLL